MHTLGEAYCNLDRWRAPGAASGSARPSGASWSTTSPARTRRAPLLGACRTVHADVLLATGRWPEAEEALESALATHARYVPEMGAPTVATLAELRVRQGRLPEAEQLLAGREEHPVVAARARPAAHRRGPAAGGGRAARARAARHRRTTPSGRRSCWRRSSTPAWPAAIPAARRPRRTSSPRCAAASRIRLVGARADLAAARVALAGSRRGDAAEPARRALAAFSRLAMPLDAGEARLELARALAAEAPDSRRDEARTALAAFRELGASRAMDAAARGCCATSASGPARRRARAGELTAREQEVLGLLALGMSNAQIAQTLSSARRPRATT